jgi:hypothetical protein
MTRYLGRLDVAAADELQARLHELLTDTYVTGDLDTAVPALRPYTNPALHRSARRRVVGAEPF